MKNWVRERIFFYGENNCEKHAISPITTTDHNITLSWIEWQIIL